MHRYLALTPICLFCAYGTLAQAKPAKKPAPAAPANNDAAEAASAAKKAAEEAFVQKHYTALKAGLPNLRESDVRGLSKEDLKKLYIKSYEATGMHLIEARQKADSLDLN